jgi:hypothetical protein
MVCWGSLRVHASCSDVFFIRNDGERLEMATDML